MAVYRVTVSWPAARWAREALYRNRNYRALRRPRAGSFAALARRAAATAAHLGIPVGLAVRKAAS